MTKAVLSTYDELMQNPEFKKKFEVAYKEFILSELFLAVMEEDHISVRKLAEIAGVSPTLIQDIRSGKRENITMHSFSSIMDALGYDLVIEKRRALKGTPRSITRFRIGSATKGKRSSIRRSKSASVKTKQS